MSAHRKLTKNQSPVRNSNEALRHTAAHFQALIKNALDLITVLNANGIIVFQSSSAERFLGYPPEALVGRNAFDLIHVGDAAMIRERFFQLIQGRSCEKPLEFRFRHKNGEWHLLEANALNLLENPHICGILVNARDITERRRLEEEILKVSEAEQIRIAEDLHDGLTQHLAAIQLMGKMLEQKLTQRSLPEAADAAKITQYLNQAITKTRDLSRGLYPLGLESQGLIRALQDLSHDVAKRFRIQCVFDCDDSVGVREDAVAAHVYYIVREAVKNAIRHGKADRISISATSVDHKIVLTVRDNGLGFPGQPDEHNGIGLRIMHHRARIIDASLEIQENENGGMTVICAFPKTAPNRKGPG